MPLSDREQLLVDFGKSFDLRDFVETGTLIGTMFRAVQKGFDRAFTIDKEAPTPGLAAEFADSSRVFLLTGSSGDMLGDVLQKHKITRALFWLDAHGNETYYVDDGNNQVPKELAAIEKYAPDSLVVVDNVTVYKGEYWVNTSYVFTVPKGWQVVYHDIVAILHRGGYTLPEGL